MNKLKYIRIQNEDGSYGEKIPFYVDSSTVEVSGQSLATKINEINSSLANKVIKEQGKGLSSNDYTNEEKQKLSNIEAGATNTIIDSTLSKQGEAADAKAVGDKINSEKMILQQAINAQTEHFNTEITELQSLVGSPLVAITVAEMIDIDKIYVYVGSETEYINGNWYYYDGTNWVSGGIYNSVALAIDSTPTQGSNNAVSSGGVYDALNAVPRENLIPFPYSSGAADEPSLIRDGVTFVVNDDGSLTCDGTATADTYFNFSAVADAYPIKAGTYTISGITQGSSATYRLYAMVKDVTNTTTVGSWTVTTAPVSFTLSVDGCIRYCLFVKSGTVFNSITIYPMLEKGATAHDYVPPAKGTAVDITKLKASITNASADALQNVESVVSEIFSKSDITTTFVCGTLNESTGAESNSKYAIRSAYISGSAGDIVSVTTPIGYRASVLFYSGTTYITDSCVRVIEKTLLIQLPENATQWRIVFYKYSDYKHNIDNTDNVAEIQTHLIIKKLTGNAYNGFVGLYKYYPTITKNGESYTVTITGYTRTSWSGGHVIGASHTQTETLGNAKVLLYLKDSDTFVLTDISTVDGYRNSIPLLGNFKGAIYGPWAIYYFNSLPEEEQPLIPDYYNDNDYLDNKMQEIKDIGLNLGKHSGRFFFVTDYHISQNTRISPYLIAEIGAKTGINKTVFGGDSIQSYTTAQEAFRAISDFVADFEDIRNRQDVFFITGNHEQNNPSANPDYTSRMVPVDAIYRLFNDQMHGVVNLDDSGNSFYFDDISAKVRYYCVGCDYDAQISVETRQKFGESLEDTPDGYAVLLISHTGIFYNSTTQVSSLTSRFTNIMQCCKAMHDGSTVTITDVGAYDYTGRNRKFVGAIIGHSHFDDLVVYDSRFPVILTTCDAYDAVPSAHPAPERVAGTIYEQAFDVVQFDVDDGYIYLTRIGDGDNRTVKCWTDAGLVE